MLKITLGLAAAAMAASACQAAEASDTSGGACRTGLTAGQASNARAIVRVANDLNLPIRAKVIGIATALQESDLDENEVGDGGRAIGVFQQHPEWGWNRTNVEASARRFFARLVKVDGWQVLPLTVAAQRVQRSAHPGAYAKHEGRAERIVARLTTCKGGR